MEYIMAAIAFGLSAGLTPGPFMALVVAESIKGGWKKGAFTSIAPVITDGIMILASLIFLNRLSETALAVMQAVGGGVMLYFAYGVFQFLRKEGGDLHSGTTKKGKGDEGKQSVSAEPTPLSLGRGIVVNMLNPSAWLFWFTAGGSVLRDAWIQHIGWAISFLVIFFALLVGSNILVAFAAGQRRWGSSFQRVLLMFSAIALLLLALQALYQASSQLIHTKGLV